MNFYYEIDDSFDDEETSYKNKIIFNKKFIIALLAILFFVLLIILIINLSPNRKYLRMENMLLEKARKYIELNNSSIISNEIYLSANSLDVELDSSCMSISGVFYDGKKYTPYLKCQNYESKILENTSDTIKLYGNDVIVLARGINFYDPGFSSVNSVEILGEVGTTEGVYNLYYHDTVSNTFLIRKIVIINDENLKNDYPKITLNGEEVVYVTKGSIYHDEGVVATDLVDGDISDKAVINGEINTSDIGKYKITYSITNSRGYQNTIERIVNVIDSDTKIYVDYVIEPSTKVNDNVVITLSIHGKVYDYMTLPSGEKVSGNTINYKVYENGKYVFLIHDKMGNATDAEIIISNIDKEPPKATCEAIVYNGYTQIDVTSVSNKAISTYEYRINNTTMNRSNFSSYKISNTSVSKVEVIIEDNVGNKNTVNCDIMPYENWKTDYSRLNVYLKNTDDNTIIKKYSLEDYLKGVVYLSLIDVDFNKYSSNQLLELFKSLFVLKKAELFSVGKYNIYSKQLIFNINETKYCDVYSGCKLVSKNSKSFYLANDVDFNFDKEYSNKYNGLDNNIIEIMSKAYSLTKMEVVVTNDFNDVLTKYTSSYTQITDSIKNSIINSALTNNNYIGIIASVLPNYKIYNINNYSSKFSEALKNNTSYYWPIGSIYADYHGLFSGTPEWVEVLYNYGASIVDNKMHDGMAIRGECGKTKVIASKDGRVTKIGNSPQYGDYVIIEHDNNISFLYGSLASNSISVTVGSVVRKGQLIGFVGSSDNTCMLYIEVFDGGNRVNPSEYISIDNVRPASGERIVYVEGGSVKRSVCLSLLASGFSIDATAGIMGNMQRESNFTLDTLGDGGTSVGLLQWHRVRYNSLSSFCRNRIYTTECQLEYMLSELKGEFKKTYDYLLDSNSAYEIGNYMCRHFLMPAESATTCPKRGEVARDIFVPYVLNNCN